MPKKVYTGASAGRRGFGGGGGFSGGVSKFIQLTDAPNSYIGKAGQLVQVKDDETGLQFNPEMSVDRHDVKASATDPTPDFLNGKVDGATVEVSSDKIQATNRPVLSIFDNTSALPVSPATGDRYIAKVTAHGWTINNIYEWTGSAWRQTVPYTGFRVWNVNTTTILSYTGTVWQQVLGDHKVTTESSDTVADYLRNKIYNSATALGAIDTPIMPIGPGESRLGLVINADGKSIIIDDFNELRCSNLPVLGFFDNTSGLPATPTVGDRWIAEVTAHGWTAGNIYECTATTPSVTWMEFVPYVGMTLFKIDTWEYMWYCAGVNDFTEYWRNIDFIDGAAGIPSLRTLGLGLAATQKAAPGVALCSVDNADDEAAAFAAGAFIVIRTDLLV